MLICALATSGYWNDDYSLLKLGYPAQCFFHPNSDLKAVGYNGVYVALSAALIGISYIIRIPQLFLGTSNWIKNTFRTRPTGQLKNWVVGARIRAVASPGFARFFWNFIAKTIFWVYCMLGAATELYGSLLWEVCFVPCLVLGRKQLIIHTRPRLLGSSLLWPGEPFAFFWIAMGRPLIIPTILPRAQPERTISGALVRSLQCLC